MRLLHSNQNLVLLLA